jgi:hypothetical protein
LRYFKRLKRVIENLKIQIGNTYNIEKTRTALSALTNTTALRSSVKKTVRVKALGDLA